MRRYWYIVLTMMLSLGSANVHSASRPSIRTTFDVVTLKNGEIYNGAVARPSFVMRTAYGDVSVPYGMMKRLRNTAEGAILDTHEGERIRGRLQHDEFQVLRVLDPTLPVDWTDIREIAFARRRTRATGGLPPDQLWLGDDQRLLANVLPQELLVRSAEGIHLVSVADIETLEIDSTEGREYPRVLLRRGGIQAPLLGDLLTPVLKVTVIHGGEAEIPSTMLKAVLRQVNQARNVGGRFPKFQPFRVVRPGELRDALRSGGLGPALITIESGSYRRGDPQGDHDEKPPRLLSIRPFAMGVFEVTFAEYDRYCHRTTSCDSPDDQEWGRGARPVVNVSWEEAKAYTEWLSEETGQRYRLPTDGEWEYAARAGSTGKFWWGEEPGSARANCEGCGALWDGEKSVEVGRFPPNAFGLHDTAGNVWEWVEDCWSDTFADAPADGSAIEKAGCGKRVIRGGAWSFPSQEMRSANRWRDFPSRRSDDTGFRVVRELDSGP